MGPPAAPWVPVAAAVVGAMEATEDLREGRKSKGFRSDAFALGVVWSVGLVDPKNFNMVVVVLVVVVVVVVVVVRRKAG